MAGSLWVMRSGDAQARIIMMREHAAHYRTKTGHGCMRLCGLRMAE